MSTETDSELDLIAVKEIQERIRNLTELKDDKDALKFGMRELQKALLQNPAACSLLLPEDIGAAVAMIRHYTGKEVQEEQTKATTSKAKKVNLDPKNIDKLLEEEL